MVLNNLDFCPCPVFFKKVSLPFKVSGSVPLSPKTPVKEFAAWLINEVLPSGLK